MRNDLLSQETALALLHRDLWPVVLHPPGVMIPTRDGPKVATGKEPIGRAWGASKPTEADLRRLFPAHPEAGVGIVLGPDGYVIDIEIDGPEGADSLVKLFGGEVVETLGWSSRRGPHHLFLWDDRLAALANGSGVIKCPALPGLEIRVGGAGKQLQSACPPTVGEDGVARRWNGCDEVAPLPEAALRFLAEALAKQAEPRAADGAAPDPFVVTAGTADPAAAWFGKALANEAGKVAMARDGDRHKALLAAARTLGGFLHHGYLSEAEVAAELTHAGRRAGLPEQEVAATIRDGLAYGKAQPLRWPEKLDRPAGTNRNGEHRAPDPLGPGPGARVEPGAPDDDAEPLPEPDWPEPPSSEAYHGLPGRVVAAFDPHTESDPIGLLVQFLVMFGSLVGRGPRYHVEATPHHVNEFAVLVGRSSMGRKGTGAGRVKALLKEVDPAWASGRLRSGLSTGEGLIGMVRDPLYEKQPIKSKGRVVDYQEVMTDEGVSDKRLCMLETEFGAVLKALEREGNRLSGVLRLAWDGEALATATKSPVRATDAHVSIVGHITRDELLSLIQRVEIASGLANRFLWLAVRRCRVLPFGGSPGDLSPLVRETAAAAEFARGADLMTMSLPAKGLWCDHYERLTTPPPGALGEVLSRGAPHVIRLAMLYALTDRESVITDDHLRAALALWDASARCAAFIFGDGTGDRTADRILAALRAAPGGMTRSEIRRSVFGDHVTAARVRAALSLLLSAGQVRQVADRATGGAPAIRYFAVRERERREKRDNPPSGEEPEGASHANHAFHAHAGPEPKNSNGRPEADPEVVEL
jgi:hypothetical protein